MSQVIQATNLPELTVSELSGALKRMVEDAFPFVRVRGEISGLKAAASGHVYFDLKDDKAVLNAIVWKPAARTLKLRPEPGMEVVCTGKITTYPGSSRYQLIVETMELAGAGALMALIEQRKQKLAAEGLFDAARKKPLPFLPEVIGVVTSPAGAVIRDILHRISERFPRYVLLWPVAVQGEKAAAEIAAAIDGFNALAPGGAIPRPDVLIVARGGGSIEDLMAFNEENVVRAAAASRIPLISAVGHETDTTLIDFASDRRAPTPTAAAEMAVPVRADLVSAVQDAERRASRGFARGMAERRTLLNGLARALPRADQLFASPRQRFDTAAERLAQALRRNVALHRQDFTRAATLLRPKLIQTELSRRSDRLTSAGARLARSGAVRWAEAGKVLEGLVRVLESASYRKTLERGYAVVRGADGRLRRAAGQIAAGETLTLVFADGERGALAHGEGAKPKPAKPAAPGKTQGSLF